ncbi:MAG TPA: enoyl-CoA hydratase-related protein [Stellaceae bacterium]|nr:enoyl-CoA hydratase-related protein [Stellaceae bacterium]
MPKVIVERHGAVLEIVLNRPEVLNAVDRETIEALAAAAAEAAEDKTAHAVLLRGAGTHFCAGGDIGMFARLIELPPEQRRMALYRIVEALHPLLVRLRYMPKPVVAAVQGAAAGFGLSLVLAADLALAAGDAAFSCGYINLGTSPDGGMTAILPTVVGLKRASELMLLGERIGATDALALGLVNRLATPERLRGEAGELAARLAAGPTTAYARTKALLQQTIGDAFEAQLRREAENFAACAASDDFVEGVRAFREKRHPNFTGKP